MIIASALIHDIGMVIKESEVHDLLSNKSFCDYIKKWNSFNKDEWCRYGIPRLAIADFVRLHHPERIMQMVVSDDIIPKSLTEGSTKLRFWLGKISAGHGMRLEDICNPVEFPTSVDIQLLGGMVDKCNPRFLTFCLRLGDLLDIGTARACPILRHLSEPLSSISQSHWDQYKDIEIRGLQPRSEITIAGTCPTQNAERLLREWVSWIEEEVSLAVAVQNQDKSHYYLHLGRIRYAVQPAMTGGRTAYEFLEFRFNLDEKMVFERLFGKALYGRPELALREIIQNAVDAQRALILKELSSSPDWEKIPEIDRKFAFRRNLLKVRDSMPITISLTKEENQSGNPYTWLTIIDHGVGMTRETIEQFLLKVGRSRWGNDPTVARYGIGSMTIGTFGIGFLSSLMIADRVIIETRSCLPNQEGIRATIYGWQSYLATEPISQNNSGTSISLRLNQNYFTSPFQLASILSELVPLIDFAILVEFGTEKLSIPQLYLGKERDNKIIQTTMALDHEGSIISIIGTSGYLRNKLWVGDQRVINEISKRMPQIILCQDGITVNEMSYPQDLDPESQMLGRLQVLVDLRSDLRVPLDLSRNLVEGGQQQFWRMFVPRAVDKICEAYSFDNIAFEAISDLINETFESITDDPLRFAQPEGPLLSGLASIQAVNEITCIEVANIQTHLFFREENMVAWLMPTPHDSELLIGGWTPDDGLIHTAVGSLKYYGKPPDVDIYSQPGIMIRKRSTRIDKEWRRLTREFNWIGPGSSTLCRLYRTQAQGTQNVNQIIGFRVTPGWLTLTEPWGGVLTLVPTEIFRDLPSEAYKHGLTLPDYYIFLIYHLFDWPEPWDVGRHSYSEQFAQVAKLDMKRYAEEDFDEDNEDYEDGDYDYDDDDDDDRIKKAISRDLDSLLGENLIKSKSFFVGIAKKAGLERAVCSWELSQWKRGEYVH